MLLIMKNNINCMYNKSSMLHHYSLKGLTFYSCFTDFTHKHVYVIFFLTFLLQSFTIFFTN